VCVCVRVCVFGGGGVFEDALVYPLPFCTCHITSITLRITEMTHTALQITKFMSVRFVFNGKKNILQQKKNKDVPLHIC